MESPKYPSEAEVRRAFVRLEDAIREHLAAYDDIAQGHAVAGAWLEAWRFERLRECLND